MIDRFTFNTHTHTQKKRDACKSTPYSKSGFG